MSKLTCTRNNCNGTIDDGYCDTCGMAALKSQSELDIALAATASNQPAQSSSSSLKTAPNSASVTGTGSSPTNNRSSRSGTRRSAPTAGKSSRRQLGAGLVSIPELPSTAPELAVLAEAKVPENKRFCAGCNQAVKRDKGFCTKCGQKYNFVPSLAPGDVVGGQYEVKGAIAYGGLGWIYLGFDNLLSRYVVLKGLLNSEDAASAAVALAERQFLAAVKHPNIVGIYNFVTHAAEGYIVMEYVGGKTLKEIRKERGTLPVAEAIAYIHRVLGAFAYLHQLGLVYCDFKPDNVMLEGDDIKLIDLGGARKIDDPDGDIYGTIGYAAPEAGEGPTVVSDLFTIGRTLAVLVTNISGFSTEHQYTLPSAQSDSVFAQQESLYRFLLKATAPAADDRFQNAEEMAEQLLGVLREVVAAETKTPRPANSSLFDGDRLALIASGDFSPIKPSYLHLPNLLIDPKDPAANVILNASMTTDRDRRIEQLKKVVKQVPISIEAKLRLATNLIDRGATESAGDFTEAELLLEQVAQQDAWDWRVDWYRGKSLLAQNRPQEAQAAFDRVYFDLPGELAPKLAFALAAEQGQNYQLAAQMYEIVERTDLNYPTAAFGLTRCRLMQGDRNAAVTALQHVPPTSNLYTRAKVEIARILVDRQLPVAINIPKHPQPTIDELKSANQTLESLTLEGIEKYRLDRQVLETALNLLTSKAIAAQNNLTILGQPLEEIKLREGLEKVLRSMAHLSTGEEKILLVDEANRVRPKTLF
ncbi:serine/threonine-protein kinase [Chamaesiphon minutus]|uniref:Serine/threonine-protein kinase PknG n=1 Tax=Chamaesiphon minutus (strain ATCC 27169 / PCC 6605) TaxID=1173020 RepID=K9UPQ1_CHAP6|nr:serine/threonine-protein kinase [Chamaesiphon minutus]AFY96184.1 serine/threonine protein kinase [Chamaesiphon minutus PCC 6605]